MTEKLCIVAGGGDLPARIIQACQQSGRPFFVLAVEGQANHPLIDNVPHAWIRMGAAGKAEKIMRTQGVAEVVLGGWIRRPSLREIRPDRRAAKLMLKAGMHALGDDGLLRALIREVEASGFRVVAVQDVVPELLTKDSLLSRKAPDDQAITDICRAVEIVRMLGRLDVGQGAVVQQGIVLGVEAIEGTDALIERSATLRRRGAGGVLVKLKKVGQDRRVDIPAIGPRTIECAAAAKLRGIAIEAGGSLIIDEAETIAAANKKGIFLIGIAPDRFLKNPEGPA